MSNNYSDQFAELILQELKKGPEQWRQYWKNTFAKNPLNGSTFRRYRGFNCIKLSILMNKKGWEDPRFFTLKQLEDMGGRVLPDQEPTLVRYCNQCYGVNRYIYGYEKNGRNFVIRYSEVYNAEQCYGLPAIPGTYRLKWAPYKQVWEPYEMAEKVIENSGITILYDQNSMQYYDLNKDQVHLTPRGNFFKADDFYCTAFHEMAHATGHKKRLNRNLSGCRFGSKKYAQEELRAEIASMMICSKLGIASGEMNELHLGYIDSWVKLLEDSPTEIVRACNAAESICKWLFSRVENEGELNLYDGLLILRKPTEKVRTPEEIAAEAAKNKERIANNPEYAKLQEQLLRMKLTPSEIKERIQLLKIGKAHLGLDHRCKNSDMPNEA